MLGLLGLIIAAQFSITLDFSALNIPITGQTLGVILVTYFLPGGLGILAVFLYLLLGGMGLPVFAEGSSGWDKFSAGTGGFLIGFLVAAIFIYWAKKAIVQNHFFQNLIINIGGTIVIIICGLIWLTNLYGFSKALEYGFYPFWLGAVVKIILGILIISIYQYTFLKSEGRT